MKLQLCTALLTASTIFTPLSLVAQNAQNPADAKRAAVGAYGKLPLSFEPTENSARFLAHSGAYAVTIGVRESSVAIPSAKSGGTRTLRFAFENANLAAPLSALEPLPGVTNYYLGQDSSKWRLGVKNYNKVRAQGIYPGVDVVYYGDHRRLEFDFVVAPKADPRAIALSFSGMDKFYKDASGDLIAEVNGQPVRFAKPYAYQKVAGISRPVAADYELASAGSVRFHLGNYDRNAELIIDPVVSYANYLGGGLADSANGIAVDSDGTVYVTGMTSSNDFPDNPDLNTQHYKPSIDAYVVKYKADGTGYVYTAILGGANGGWAEGNGIALDSNHQVYIIGATNFTDLPTGTAPKNYLNNLNRWQGGDSDAFIAIIAADGTLLRTSYLGGSSADLGYGIVVDANKNVIAVGETCSQDFPGYNAFETKIEACVAFFTELDNGLDIGVAPGNGASALSYMPSSGPGGAKYYFSGFYGGQLVAPFPTANWFLSTDYVAGAIIVDPNGNVQIANNSGTTSASLPSATTWAWATALKGQTSDGTISWVNEGPSVLAVYATTKAYGVALDPVGDIFVAGGTSSASLSPFSAYAGSGAWVLKVTGAPTPPSNTPAGYLRYGTVLETTSSNSSITINAARAIAVDTQGQAYVTGTVTGSLHPSPGLKSTIGGSQDAFLIRMDNDGGIAYASYLGGSGLEEGLGVAVDASGAAYVTGSTQSDDFPTINPLTDPNSIPIIFQGTQKAFVTKFNTNGSALILSAFIGGSGDEQGNAIAVDSGKAGNMYVAGTTSSTDFERNLNPASYTAPQATYGGGVSDAFVAMVAGASLPSVTVIPSGSLSFGSQELGAASAPQLVQYENTTVTSSSTVTILSITFSGAAGGDFRQAFPNTAPGNCAPGPIQGSATCNIWVVFTPSAGQARSGVLTITDDYSSTPHVIRLTGTGEVPQDAFSANSLDFGAQAVGTTSTAQSLTLQNTGQGALDISSITVAGDFSRTSSCPTQLASGSSCAISVTFTPTAAGKLLGSLTITDNSPGSPHPINLTGTGTSTGSGTPGSGAIQLTPASVAFGNQQVNTLSSIKIVTLTNSSSSTPLPITGITFTGSNAGDFADQHNCPATLTAGASCQIQLAFKPTSTGAESAIVTVTGTASNSPQTVTLTGTGIAGSGGGTTTPTGTNYTLTPDAAGVSVTEGTTAVYSFSVAPISGFKNLITFTCSGPVGSSCSLTPTSLQMDGSTTPPAVKLYINTTGGNGVTAKSIPAGLASRSIFLAILPFSMMGMLLIGKRRGFWLVLMLVALCMAVGMVGCGGSGSGSTSNVAALAPGSYQITLTAASTGTTSVSQTLNLVVNKK